jgi:hypothetical protein
MYNAEPEIPLIGFLAARARADTRSLLSFAQATTAPSRKWSRLRFSNSRGRQTARGPRLMITCSIQCLTPHRYVAKNRPPVRASPKPGGVKVGAAPTSNWLNITNMQIRSELRAECRGAQVRGLRAANDT